MTTQAFEPYGAPFPGGLIDGGQRWMGFRAVDRVIVGAHVADVLEAGAASLPLAEMLAAVAEVAAVHLGLTHAVLWKRMAGHSRAVAWSAPGASSASHIAARERAWTAAAAVVDGVAALAGAADPDQPTEGSSTNVALSDEALGLSAMLHVEARRSLDADDRAFLDEMLRRMMGLDVEPAAL
jgi:hypothetical protein